MPELRSGRSSISASENGGRPLQASGLLREMERQNVAPDVINYNAAISACEKGARPVQALELLDGMLQQSVEPDVTSYNAAMSTCENGAQPEQALHLLREMLLQCDEPDVISYNAQINASDDLPHEEQDHKDAQGAGCEVHGSGPEGSVRAKARARRRGPAFEHAGALASLVSAGSERIQWQLLLSAARSIR